MLGLATMGRKSRKKQENTPTVSAPVQRDGEQTAGPVLLLRLDFVIAVAVILISFSVFFLTLCPTIYTSGAGENVTAVATLGVPHPPGFPLFCLLGKLAVWLIPVGSMAWRVNIFSAFCGSVAAGLLYLALRKLHGNGSWITCAPAALLFAFSRTFWSQAVIAEVYTLNALILTAILLSLLWWRDGGKLWPAALLAGLGLTVHPLQALLLPAWLYIVWRSPARQRIRGEQWMLPVVCMLAGLSLHLYPYFRSKANPPLDWGNPENLRNLAAYLTASQYRGRMFSLEFKSVIQNLWNAIRLLAFEGSPAWFALVLPGGWLFRRQNRMIFYATAISALAVIFYAINYNIPWEIDVYYIPVVLIFSIWMSFALAWISRRAGLFRFILLAIPLAPLLYHYSSNDRSRHFIMLAYGQDILRTCPPDSSLILQEVDAAFPVLYLTAVEKQRPDLRVWVGSGNSVTTLRDGVNPDAKATPIRQLLTEANGPVLQTLKVTAETVPGYRQDPFGMLFRLVPQTSKPETALPDFSRNQLERFVSPLPDFFLDDRSRVILSSYMISKGDSLLANGMKEQALKAYSDAEALGGTVAQIRSQLGMRYAETGDTQSAIVQLQESLKTTEDASVYNRLGRLLAESGKTDEAMSAFLRALELDPNLAIAHSNLGALFGMKGELAKAWKEVDLALRQDPQSAPIRNNRARLFLMEGHPERAIPELRRSLEIDPSQPKIRQWLSELEATHR